MTLSRGIPLPIHGAIEMVAAPAIMVAPFVLGFGQAAAAVSVAFGVLLLAVAVQVESPRRALPISAHAGFDYLLAAAAAAAGIAIGIATGAWDETVFLVGIGAAQVVLAAMTRFSAAPRSA